MGRKAKTAILVLLGEGRREHPHVESFKPEVSDGNRIVETVAGCAHEDHRAPGSTKSSLRLAAETAKQKAVNGIASLFICRLAVTVGPSRFWLDSE